MAKSRGASDGAHFDSDNQAPPRVNDGCEDPNSATTNAPLINLASLTADGSIAPITVAPLDTTAGLLPGVSLGDHSSPGGGCSSGAPLADNNQQGTEPTEPKVNTTEQDSSSQVNHKSDKLEPVNDRNLPAVPDATAHAPEVLPPDYTSVAVSAPSTALEAIGPTSCEQIDLSASNANENPAATVASAKPSILPAQNLSEFVGNADSLAPGLTHPNVQEDTSAVVLPSSSVRTFAEIKNPTTQSPDSQAIANNESEAFKPVKESGTLSAPAAATDKGPTSANQGLPIDQKLPEAGSSGVAPKLASDFSTDRVANSGGKQLAIGAPKYAADFNGGNANSGRTLTPADTPTAGKPSSQPTSTDAFEFRNGDSPLVQTLSNLPGTDVSKTAGSAAPKYASDFNGQANSGSLQNVAFGPDKQSPLVIGGLKGVDASKRLSDLPSAQSDLQTSKEYLDPKVLTPPSDHPLESTALTPQAKSETLTHLKQEKAGVLTTPDGQTPTVTDVQIQSATITPPSPRQYIQAASGALANPPVVEQTDKTSYEIPAPLGTTQVQLTQLPDGKAPSPSSHPEAFPSDPQQEVVITPPPPRQYIQAANGASANPPIREQADKTSYEAPAPFGTTQVHLTELPGGKAPPPSSHPEVFPSDPQQEVVITLPPPRQYIQAANGASANPPIGEQADKTSYEAPAPFGTTQVHLTELPGGKAPPPSSHPEAFPSDPQQEVVITPPPPRQYIQAANGASANPPIGEQADKPSYEAPAPFGTTQVHLTQLPGGKVPPPSSHPEVFPSDPQQEVAITPPQSRKLTEATGAGLANASLFGQPDKLYDVPAPSGTTQVQLTQLTQQPTIRDGQQESLAVAQPSQPSSFRQIKSPWPGEAGSNESASISVIQSQGEMYKQIKPAGSSEPVYSTEARQDFKQGNGELASNFEAQHHNVPIVQGQDANTQGRDKPATSSAQYATDFNRNSDYNLIQKPLAVSEEAKRETAMLGQQPKLYSDVRENIDLASGHYVAKTELDPLGSKTPTLFSERESSLSQNRATGLENVAAIERMPTVPSKEDAYRGDSITHPLSASESGATYNRNNTLASADAALKDVADRSYSGSRTPNEIATQRVVGPGTLNTIGDQTNPQSSLAYRTGKGALSRDQADMANMTALDASSAQLAKVADAQFRIGTADGTRPLDPNTGLPSSDPLRHGINRQLSPDSQSATVETAALRQLIARQSGADAGTAGVAEARLSGMPLSPLGGQTDMIRVSGNHNLPLTPLGAPTDAIRVSGSHMPLTPLGASMDPIRISGSQGRGIGTGAGTAAADGLQQLIGRQGQEGQGLIARNEPNAFNTSFSTTDIKLQPGERAGGERGAGGVGNVIDGRPVGFSPEGKSIGAPAEGRGSVGAEGKTIGTGPTNVGADGKVGAVNVGAEGKVIGTGQTNVGVDGKVTPETRIFTTPDKAPGTPGTAGESKGGPLDATRRPAGAGESTNSTNTIRIGENDNIILGPRPMDLADPLGTKKAEPPRGTGSASEPVIIADTRRGTRSPGTASGALIDDPSSGTISAGAAAAQAAIKGHANDPNNPNNANQNGPNQNGANPNNVSGTVANNDPNAGTAQTGPNGQPVPIPIKLPELEIVDAKNQVVPSDIRQPEIATAVSGGGTDPTGLAGPPELPVLPGISGQTTDSSGQQIAMIDMHGPLNNQPSQVDSYYGTHTMNPMHGWLPPLLPSSDSGLADPSLIRLPGGTESSVHGIILPPGSKDSDKDSNHTHTSADHKDHSHSGRLPSRQDDEMYTTDRLPSRKDGESDRLPARNDDDLIAADNRLPTRKEDEALADRLPTRQEEQVDIAERLPTRKEDDIAERLPSRYDDDTKYGEPGSGRVELSEILRGFGVRHGTQADEEVDAWQAGQLSQLIRLEIRRTYKVRKGDSLTAIARRELGNGNLDELIMQLNRGLLIVDEQGNIKLKPGSHIRLPSRADISAFIAQRQDTSKLQVQYQDTSDAGDKQTIYACRLGDNLQSIAKRHPELRDARMWVLVARINNLNTRQNKAGEPVAKLKRGQKLVMPTAEQKQAFLAELAGSDRDPYFGTGSHKGGKSKQHGHQKADRDAKPKPSSQLSRRRGNGDSTIVSKPVSNADSTLVSAPILQPVSNEDSTVVSAPIAVPGQNQDSTVVSSPIASPISNEDSTVVSTPIAVPGQNQDSTIVSSPVANPIGKQDSTVVSSPIAVPGKNEDSTLVSSPLSNPMNKQDSASISSPISDGVRSHKGKEKRPALPAPQVAPIAGYSMRGPEKFEARVGAETREFTSRLVTQGDLGSGGDALALRLEIQINGQWSTVIEYKVGGGDSRIKANTRSGRQRVVKVELPTRAARELAENDLTANALVYCQEYLADRLPF